MARPQKTGIEYFPLDVDIFDDEKIEAISGEFGQKGELATIKLLCAIYRNGYFIVWNDLTRMKLTRRMHGVSPELLDTIVQRLVKWDFFDDGLFGSAQVLSSRGIQRRWREATRKRVQKESEELDYWLLEVSGGRNEVSGGRNPAETTNQAEKTPQSKVKESKVKEIKEEEERKNSTPSIEKQVEDFKTREKEKLEAEKEKNPPVLRAAPLSLEEYEVKFENDRSLLEAACITRKVSETEYREALRDFFLEKGAVEHVPISEKDIKQHFLNWLKFWKGNQAMMDRDDAKGKIARGKDVTNNATDRILQKLNNGYFNSAD